MARGKMHLVAYLKTGPTAMHVGGWRHPESTLDDIFDPVRYERTAQLLEAAKFDGAFFADFFGIGETYKGRADTFLRSGGQCSYLDPLAVLPIMGRVTRHIGLMTTISTSFVPPYFIARILASIDMLSAGRVAWNVVTSSSDTEAWNAGLAGISEHDTRYDRADEVVEACLALWNCWDPDPFVFDKKKGVFADPGKVHYADYEGQWIKSRGPLNTPQSPQGHPVLMQAGASERGRKFGARWGEILFGPSADLGQMRSYYDEMKKRVEEEGRDPGKVKILVGVTPVLGETMSIATERAAYLEALKDPEYDLAWNSLAVGADLSKHKTLDEVQKARGNQGTYGSTMAMAARADEKKTTLAEAASKTSRRELVGTAETIADSMEEMFEAGACDGFIIMPTAHPISHEQFCRAVVPELQGRGLFRREYSSTTLRGNLINNG